jgi:hypothetical protein
MGTKTFDDRSIKRCLSPDTAASTHTAVFLTSNELTEVCQHQAPSRGEGEVNEIPPEIKSQIMQKQPLVATYGLMIATVVGIIAIVIVRVYTDEIPAGLIGIVGTLAGGLLMSSGRRRI